MVADLRAGAFAAVVADLRARAFAAVVADLRAGAFFVATRVGPRRARPASTAWAAASRAMGTRNGEQLT